MDGQRDVFCTFIGNILPPYSFGRLLCGSASSPVTTHGEAQNGKPQSREPEISLISLLAFGGSDLMIFRGDNFMSIALRRGIEFWVQLMRMNDNRLVKVVMLEALEVGSKV